MSDITGRTEGGRAGDAGHTEEGLTRSILDNAHEAFVSMDTRGVITGWNREAERTFGWSAQEAIGRSLGATIIPERLRGAHWSGVQRFLEGGVASVLGKRLELNALHREGHEFPVELTISFATLGDPGEVSFHAFLHDISARHLNQQVLLAMQAVTRVMARAHTPQEAIDALLATLGRDMHWEVGGYWALGPDRRLRLAAGWLASERVGGRFQAEARELEFATGEGFPGRALADGAPVWVQDFSAEPAFPRHEAAAEAGLHAAIGVPVLRGGEVIGVLEFLTSELRVRDGAMSDALGSVGEQVGELLGILEERQALLARLERLALTDLVTGLPNRRAWEEGLIRELARASRDAHPVCVAVIDVDGFKRFNDEHGHPAGDALLREAAAAWLAQLRAGDLLARYGGDEFAAVIPAWPLDTVVTVLERVRASTPRGQTCSAGVAAWNGTEDPAALFARADAALYEAKQHGRDQTVAADAASG